MGGVSPSGLVRDEGPREFDALEPVFVEYLDDIDESLEGHRLGDGIVTGPRGCWSMSPIFPWAA
jgi:hypothetical protein